MWQMCLYRGHLLIAMTKDMRTSLDGKNNQLNFGMAVPIFGEMQIHTTHRLGTTKLHLAYFSNVAFYM